MVTTTDITDWAGQQIRPALSDLTLAAIQAEATRAHLKHGEHSMFGPNYSSGERLAILVEEVGEVAHELTYDQGGAGSRRDELVKELIQVAAMAASWVEVLEGSHEAKAPPPATRPIIEPGGTEAKAVDLRDLIAEILGTFVAGDYDALARPSVVASTVEFRQHGKWRERAGLAPGAAFRGSADPETEAIRA